MNIPRMELSLRLAMEGARAGFLDALRVAFSLYKIMIPIIIAVKILVELDLIRYLAMPLSPLMALVGLPADLGLVWAFAIVVNIYASLVVLAGILPSLPALTAAQATTFATMMLIAHGLILESRIAQQCGVSFHGQFIIRLAGAVLCGMLMHFVYSVTGTLQQPAAMLLPSPGPDPSLAEWAFGEARNLFYIFWIIVALMILQRFLVYSRLERLLDRIFSPLLILLGINPRAATCIVVGFSMGLLYGSGIIIKESQTAALSKKDVFCAVTLIGLAHALIEDTLLMLLIGGAVSGTVGLRMLFAITFSLFLTRVYIALTARAG
jgi:hypothetical protein